MRLANLRINSDVKELLLQRKERQSGFQPRWHADDNSGWRCFTAGSGHSHSDRAQANDLKADVFDEGGFDKELMSGLAASGTLTWVILAAAAGRHVVY